MQRSEFLYTAAVAGIGSLCCATVVGGLLTGCSSSKYVDGTESGGFIVVPLAAFSQGDGTTDTNTATQPVTVRKTGAMQGPIYIVRAPDNTYTALSLVCTHKSCIVRPVGTGFECPCHGSEFSADGSVLSPPAKEPLKRYAVTVDGVNLSIKL